LNEINCALTAGPHMPSILPWMMPFAP